MTSENTIGPHWRFLESVRDCRFVLMYGGAASGKSWTMAEYLLLDRFANEAGCGVLVLRKTVPSIRQSCWRLMLRWIDHFQIPCQINRSTWTITAANGSLLQFSGLDDVNKLKSIEQINYIWLEEATEFTEADFMQLNLRCRAANLHGNNQLFFTFNPVDPIGNQWLETMTTYRPRGHYLGHKIAVYHANFGDNPFLADEDARTIEGLADQDEEFNKIYRLGEWARPTNLIYSNWDVVDDFPRVDDYGYGLDFGYVNPTALIWVGVKDEQNVYLREVVYEDHLHNVDLIQRMQQAGIHPTDTIIADSAQPAYIDEIAAAGFNCHPCEKSGEAGKPFVRTGIDRVKRCNLHILRTSQNLIREASTYKWKVDKDGNVLDEPFKWQDHALDAVRYFIGSRPEPVALEVIGQYVY